MDVPRKGNRIKLVRVIPLLLAVVLISVLILSCKASSEPSGTTENGIPLNQPCTPCPCPTLVTTGSCSAMALSNSIAGIVEQVEPAVVFISAEIETESFFFGKTIQESSGSGVIISSDGYIVTNNHVVEGAANLKVTVPGMIEAFEADIIGIDPLTDLAVIKVDSEDLPTVPFGSTSKLRPGELVIAMGYPLALDQGATITLGVVSNIERSFTVGDSTYYDVIQTDAAINQGNSGGPLIDLNGSLVGINSVLFGGAQNIGFAISVNTAQPVYEALTGIDHRVIRPWLGVVLADVTPDIADEANLSRQSGVVITQVVRGSPADIAGLQTRDVISQFDGIEMVSASQLIKSLWHYRIGDRVTITYWRDGQENESVIELTVERPS